MGIQGPVANYGGGQTPFQAPPPPMEAGERTQTNRVYAVLTAVVMLVCISAVAAMFFKDHLTGKPEEVAKVETPVPSAEPPPKTKPKAKADGDTGMAKPAPAPKPVKPSSGGGKTPKPSTGGTPAPAPPPRGNGSFSVTLNGGGATSIEVNCPSGFRERGSFSGTRASVANVPNEPCTVNFKGGAPAKFSPVRGNQSLTCTITGSTAVCN